ncbi:hypothetical protein OSB04_009532 [Centaurea solstitialis]|uniref:TCP domain-containing protein n=1 Tax=Centaurea solstitialis TaxID=347529 RepID=A0AA38TQP8_9ASTR|nr:hypothetical protein OSB04_009532 [Centaurea solstitialis]
MNQSSSNSTTPSSEARTHPPPRRDPQPPPFPPMARCVRPRNTVTKSRTPIGKYFGPNWLPSPFMTSDLVPHQLTPVRALAPEYSQTETTNLAVPKLYAARIRQLKDELKLQDEGEAVKWLLKQSEPAIIMATGTGTMPIMTSSSVGPSNHYVATRISAPIAGNPPVPFYDSDHGESSSGDNE